MSSCQSAAEGSRDFNRLLFMSEENSISQTPWGHKNNCSALFYSTGEETDPGGNGTRLLAQTETVTLKITCGAHRGQEPAQDLLPRTALSVFTGGYGSIEPQDFLVQR